MHQTEKIKQLRALTAADPDDALGWFMLGTALVQEVAETAPEEAGAGLYKEAAAALERCIARNPKHTAAYRWLGDAQRKAGHATQAADTYRQAIRIAEETGDLQVAREARAWLANLARTPE